MNQDLYDNLEEGLYTYFNSCMHVLFKANECSSLLVVLGSLCLIIRFVGAV